MMYFSPSPCYWNSFYIKKDSQIQERGQDSRTLQVSAHQSKEAPYPHKSAYQELLEEYRDVKRRIYPPALRFETFL
jgi:hypothetical protein